MNIFNTLLDPVYIPEVAMVHQNFERPAITDVSSTFLEKLQGCGVLDKINRGSEVAIAIGSRGISNQPALVKLLVGEIKKKGATPFLVPAMGSHGGATPAGQKRILVDMGFSEAYIGASIRATMEVNNLGYTENGLPLNIDKFAYEADAIIIINRIKPHVGFRGKYESGLMKMIAIGLGKQKGADACHELGFGKMAENVPALGRAVIKKTNIVCAIALLENAYHETSRIEILNSEEIEQVEPKLLEEAIRLTPRLYFNHLDVLIIDEIGKDISGTGFDTNIVGRYHTPYASGGPDITRIVVLDLTEKSHGNANGLGIVDFTTRRVLNKFDFVQTYPNSLTSTVPASVKIPMVLENDLHAIQAAIKTCNIPDKKKVRLVRIKNTVKLTNIEISESLIEEVKQNPNLEIINRLYELPFDKDGNLS